MYVCVYASGRGALPGHFSPSLADLSAPGFVRSSPRVTCVCAPQTLRKRPIKKMYSRLFNVRQKICIQGSLCTCTTGGQSSPIAPPCEQKQNGESREWSYGCDLVEVPVWQSLSISPTRKTVRPAAKSHPTRPTKQNKRQTAYARVPCCWFAHRAQGAAVPSLPLLSMHGGVGSVWCPVARCWGWWVAKSVREKGAFP